MTIASVAAIVGDALRDAADAIERVGGVSHERRIFVNGREVRADAFIERYGHERVDLHVNTHPVARA